jgi:hypothetical protein
MLFRQLGVRARPFPAPRPATVENQPAFLALWLIRQNEGDFWGTTRQVPVAVYIDPSGQDIMVRSPDVEWMPLHRGTARHRTPEHAIWRRRPTR